MSGKQRKFPLPFTTPLVLMFSLLYLFSCHGDDHEKASLRPLVTTMTANVALSDSVARGDFNPYAVSVTPGLLYKISMTAVTDDLDLLFFGTDSTFTTLDQCGVDNTEIPETSPEDCIVSAGNSTLYFGVDGTFLSTPATVYVIKVEQLAITDLNLSIPILDITTQTGARVYAVPATSGAIYTVAITGLNNDADLYVFGNDAGLAATAACTIDNTLFTDTTPEDCTLTSTGNTLYFLVDGIFSTTSNVLYTAFTSTAPTVPSPGTEGSAGAPVPLSIDTPVIGQVAFAGSSYYVVSGLTTGIRYTVSINGLTNNADLTVYNNDNSFTTPASCQIDNTLYTGTTPEACTLTAEGNTIYFTVSSTISGGVAFITLVEPGP